MFYEWSHFTGYDDNDSGFVWSLTIEFGNISDADIKSGNKIDNWDNNTTAYYEDDSEYTDYPFPSGLVPVYSLRLKNLMEAMNIPGIQYLPLRVMRQDRAKELFGYHIANYLNVIDCLDREKSVYEVLTKDNLFMWEKRPHMLGSFGDVRKAVLNFEKIGDVPIFRLWGWKMMVIVREDLKIAIEKAGITGCEFSKLEVV
jgi:hypothetical protein